MRILIANLHRHLVGGVEKYLQLLVRGLLERGHSVGLLYEVPPDPKAETIDSEEMRLPVWCSANTGVQGAQHAVTEWRPDVVYSHGVEDSTLESALLERFPTVLYAHTYFGTCVSGRKCHALPRLEPCNRRLGSACLLLYFPRRCGGLDPVTMMKMFRRQSERNTSFAKFRTILVASQHMYREFEQHGVLPDRLQMLRLPLTCDMSLFPERSESRRDRILFVGRLVDVKGVHHLIPAIAEAASRLGRPLHLTVAGDGSQRAMLQQLASRMQVKVDFVGWVDDQQKRKLMETADLLAVPSLWPEPFGLVGIEAGSVGLPAAGYAVGGISDWLITGESGELASGDPPTVRGLSEAIVRALVDERHYDQLRRGAWRTAGRFTLESHLNGLEAVLGAAAAEATYGLQAEGFATGAPVAQ